MFYLQLCLSLAFSNTVHQRFVFGQYDGVAPNLLKIVLLDCTICLN